MKNFNITTRTHDLHGFKIPVGKMYGRDNKGIWICLDYRIKGMKRIAKAHYMRVRNEYGAFSNVMITPEKCIPMLTLLRLRQSTNRTWWEPVCEYGRTVDKILELVDRFPEKTIEVVQPQIVTVVYDSDKGNWKGYVKNKISSKEAKKVASMLNMATVPEYQPYARPY